jgi:hypothetical protein
MEQSIYTGIVSIYFDFGAQLLMVPIGSFYFLQCDPYPDIYSFGFLFVSNTPKVSVALLIELSRFSLFARSKTLFQSQNMSCLLRLQQRSLRIAR